MGLDTESPMAEPSAALRAPPLLLQLSQSPSQEIPCAQAPVPRPPSRSPSPQARRVKWLKEARDIIYLKEPMRRSLSFCLGSKFLRYQYRSQARCYLHQPRPLSLPREPNNCSMLKDHLPP
ncbi:UNVERIFIED_CONTAM: hypothetical protein FKN15_032762 [Acipenser sinensis]